MAWMTLISNSWSYGIMRSFHSHTLVRWVDVDLFVDRCPHYNCFYLGNNYIWIIQGSCLMALALARNMRCVRSIYYNRFIYNVKKYSETQIKYGWLLRLNRESKTAIRQLGTDTLSLLIFSHLAVLVGGVSSSSALSTHAVLLSHKETGSLLAYFSVYSHVCNTSYHWDGKIGRRLQQIQLWVWPIAWKCSGVLLPTCYTALWLSTSLEGFNTNSKNIENG